MKRRSVLQSLAALFGIAVAPRELAPVPPEALQQCATVKFEKGGTYLLLHRGGALSDAGREAMVDWLSRSGVNCATLRCEGREFEEAIRLYKL